MLSRGLITIVCISMLGMTVVPASWMPCCCKVSSKALESQKPVPSCCVDKAPANFTVLDSSSHSCQAINLQDDTSCSCGALIKGLCSACRCAEQVQVIALTGAFAQDEITKDHLTQVSEVSQPSVILPTSNPVLPKDAGLQGIVALLKTFILIC